MPSAASGSISFFQSDLCARRRLRTRGDIESEIVLARKRRPDGLCERASRLAWRASIDALTLAPPLSFV
jgi:hypothetical protein